MKISEMSNDKAAQVLIDLSEPIGRICDDEDAVAIVAEYRGNIRKPFFYALGRILPRLTANLIRTHKHDVYQIVSILGDIPLETVGSMPLAETVRILRESYDDVLTGFFTSSAVQISDGGKG